jgi:hypothetical protein
MDMEEEQQNQQQLHRCVVKGIARVANIHALA